MKHQPRAKRAGCQADRARLDTEPRARIDGVFADADFEVEARTIAAVTHRADSLTGPHFVSDGHVDGPEVRAHRVVAATVFDDDRLSVVGIGVGEGDTAGRDAAHRRAGRRAHLETGAVRARA